jgi:hypothetical protein
VRRRLRVTRPSVTITDQDRGLFHRPSGQERQTLEFPRYHAEARRLGALVEQRSRPYIPDLKAKAATANLKRAQGLNRSLCLIGYPPVIVLVRSYAVSGPAAEASTRPFLSGC